MTPRRPRMLLVGDGPGALERLEAWSQLIGRDRVDLAASLSDTLLAHVDAVDLVCARGDGLELARRCLPFAHVLVDLPPVAAASLTTEGGHVLMRSRPPGLHPVLVGLKRLAEARPEVPRGIVGTVRTREAEVCDGELEIQHLLDIVDFLFDVEPDVVAPRQRGRQRHVSLRYPGPMHATFRVGLTGRQPERKVELLYSDRSMTADLVDDALIVTTHNNQLHKSFFPPSPDALTGHLRAFVAAVDAADSGTHESGVADRRVRVTLAARPQPVRTRPRIAVMGGGIFGATCALELAGVGDVTLYERHDALLTETTQHNQQRHHSGFHYPRSYDSIAEIRAARESFIEAYGETIDRSFPAYYCTSATGIEIPAERYLAACRSNHLSFTVVDPPEPIVDPDSVSLCLATDEGVYDIERLRRLVTERVLRHPRVRCRLKTDVVAGVVTSDGTKRLTARGPDGTADESFDYLVNATYARRNLVSQWFGFPTEPLRFDLYEHLLLRLPIPQVSVTIMDGPFTSLTGTGRGDHFILSHIHDSVSRSVIPDDGMPPTWTGLVSNAANMLRHSSRYLPILREAFDVQSRWVIRAVNAYARDFDARPTVVTDHGFGCWSVLGGKVITAVANARDIARDISAEQD